MKNLMFLLVIILTIGTLSLNATSGKKKADEENPQPLARFQDYRKDVSSAD